MAFLDDLANLGKSIYNGVTQAPRFLGNAYGNALAEFTGVNAGVQNRNAAAQQDTTNTVIALTKQMKNTADPTAKLRYQNAINNINKIGNQQQANTQQYFADRQAATDPTKTLTASGSLAFDLATLGAGTGGTQAIKQAVTQGGKLAGTKVLGGQVIKNGLIAAPSGALSPIIEKGNQATLGDVATGAGTAFALGGALPVASLGLNKFGGAIKKAQLSPEGQAGFAKIPGKAPATDLAVKAPAQPQFAPNSLTQGAKDLRQNISDETIAKLDNSGHPIRNTEALNQRGIAEAATFKSNDKLINAAHERLSVKPGNISDEDISFINQAIDRADAAGNHDAASALHDSLSEHAVASGQTVQALSLLYNRSPAGLLNKATRDIKKATGTAVTGEQRAALQQLTDNIKNATNPRDKEFAIARLQQEVSKNIPQGNIQNALSVWKAGLLSGPVTHAGNALSNGTFGLLKKISDAPATAADTIMSKFTGQRTKAFTLQGQGSGFAEGAKNGLETMKTGIDRRQLINGKYEGHGELNFKNPVIQKVFGDTSNGVFRLLSSGDQPFYYAAAKNSLYDQAIAAGKNQKLSGKSLSDFVKNTVENPSKSMANQAQKEAQKAVLGEDRPIAQSISQFVGKHPALQTIVPFTKVPTNFLAQVLDYTPVGAVSKILKEVHSVKVQKNGLDQRGLAEAIGKATTGSGIIFLGAALASNDMLSGQYPTDKNEQARWKAEGITPNSIKVTNPITGKPTWISMNYVGPAGILLQAGQDFHDAAKAGDNAALASIAGVGKSLTGQSFLTGFSGFANALQDPGRYGANLINSQAGSVVPNWVAQTANAFDPNQRETTNVGTTIQSRIPGIRNDLNIKTDVYGNNLAQRTDPISLVTNPLRPSNSITSDTLAEVKRLHDIDPNNKDLQVTPTPIDKTLSIDKVQYKLTDQQKYDLQKSIGQYTQEKWSELISSPQYAQLSDIDKAKALSNLRTDAAAVAQRQFVTDNAIASYSDKSNLTNNQKNLQSNSTTLDSYAKVSDGSSGGTSVAISNSLPSATKTVLQKYNAMSTQERNKTFSTQNDAEYQYNAAKYENDKAAGNLSVADDARAKASLAKDKVGAAYSKDTRDLYSLSKSQLYQVLTTTPGGSDMADKIVAYGDALVAAGVETKNKFRTSGGAISLAPSAGGSGGGSSKNPNTSLISTTTAASKRAASAKVNTRNTAFQSKISARGLQAYKKPTATKVSKA